MSLRGIFDGGGVRKQNGHWQSSRKGMKSYVWYEDQIQAILPIVKRLTWNPMQQLNVSGSFDINVKTAFNEDTRALFGISTNGKQQTHISDTGFAYDQTIGAIGFNRNQSISHSLPLEPDDDYRYETTTIKVSLRGYTERGSSSSYEYMNSIKTPYMVDNNIPPKLRYYIKYGKYLSWGKHDNDYGSTIFEEEFEAFIPLTITTTQEPFHPSQYSSIWRYPIGNVLCTGNNQVQAHISYSFTIPAFDATQYPHIADDILSSNTYDFVVCLATGYTQSYEEDWGTRVQLSVSNVT